MSFPRVKPSGWAINEALLSSQMNQLDINVSNATDSRFNSDDLPAFSLVEGTNAMDETSFSLATGHCWIYDTFEQEYSFIGEISTDIQESRGTPNRVRPNAIIGAATAANIVGNNCKVGLNAIIVPQRDGATPELIRKTAVGGSYAAVTAYAGADITQSIAYAANTNIFTTIAGVGGGSGLGLKSTDNGDNWVASSGSPGLTSNAINPVVEGATGSDSDGTRMMFMFRLASAPPQDVEITYTDDGDTWTKVILTGSQQLGVIAAMCHNANTGSWFVATQSTANEIDFWKSTDGGDSWSISNTYTGPLGAGEPYMMRTLGKGIALILKDVTASSNGILYSRDDGLSWQLLAMFDKSAIPHDSYMTILHDPVLNIPNQVIIAFSPDGAGVAYSLRI